MELYLSQIVVDISCCMSRPHRCLNICDLLYNLSHRKARRKKDEDVSTVLIFHTR